MKNYIFLILLCFVSVEIWAESENQFVDFVQAEKTSAEHDGSLRITYLSETLPDKPFLPAGFVANHEAVFPIEKFGGTPEKGGRCGYFPEISTLVKGGENPHNIKSNWMFYLSGGQREDFEVPKLEIMEDIPFIPEDLKIKDVLKEFRLFLFAAYNGRSAKNIKTINVQDGISFDVTNLEESDMAYALYGGPRPSLDLEKYKFSADQAEFFLFKLYLEDDQRDQKIQVANFLYKKMPDGLILLDQSMDFMNWFWKRSEHSLPGKYDAYRWFQGAIYSKSKFYFLFQSYGYESISATLRSLQYQELIGIRVYSDGC